MRFVFCSLIIFISFFQCFGYVDEIFLGNSILSNIESMLKRLDVKQKTLYWKYNQCPSSIANSNVEPDLNEINYNIQSQPPKRVAQLITHLLNRYAKDQRELVDKFAQDINEITDHLYDNGIHWTYEQNGDDWTGTCKEGKAQSPIELITSESSVQHLPTLVLDNYDVILKGPLVMQNNGHSVNTHIPLTTDEKQPLIFGGELSSRYLADSFHFHWGSQNSQGSEHTINGQRYDVELHIVHRNERYGSVEEAAKHEDGLAVLGIMIAKSNAPSRVTLKSLENIMSHLPNVANPGSSSPLTISMTLGQLIGNLDTNKYYTYKGSLTTPECNEAVTWIVFSDILNMSEDYLSNLWNLLDSHNHKLINNYRNVQPTNGRTIKYNT